MGPSATQSGTEPQRGWLSAAAVGVSFAGGIAQKGVDVGRLAKKFPEAWRMREYLAAEPIARTSVMRWLHARTGRTGLALWELATMAPDTRLINPAAPAVASAASHGQSFTRFDRNAYRASSVISMALAPIQLVSGIPGLIEGVHTHGISGLVDTKAGRSGILQTGGGALGMLPLALAVREARMQGVHGIANLATHITQSKWMSSPALVSVGIGAGLLTFANEIGALDMFNTNNTRPAMDVLSDAAHKLPLI